MTARVLHLIRTRPTVVLAIIFSLALSSLALASPPLSVTLTYFRGEYRSGAVALEWQTATELNTAGFKVMRGDSNGGPFAMLDEIGIVAAQGGPTSGRTYEATDETITAGRTYWYQLIEIEFNGSEQVVETISVVADIVPTATSAGIATTDAGDDGGAVEGGATSTRAASATPGSTTTVAATGPAASATPQVQGGTPTAAAPSATVVRSFGEGNVDAAQTPSRVSPTAIAQAIDAYPGAVSTEGEALQDEPYLGATLTVSPTPMLIEATVEGYPFGDSPGAADGTSRDNRFENSVGSSAATASPAGAERAESGVLSRIILWTGFFLGLIIFVSGAVAAIVFSTRKQRSSP